MTGIWLVLFLALMPGAGNFVGGLISEVTKASPRVLNWALHCAAGIMLAIVAVELIPHALSVIAGWWIAAAFAAGGLMYVLLEALTVRLQPNDDEARGRMWMIYAAVAVDLTSDGLMIGSGSAVSAQFALILAAGQVLADLPEGYATMATFRSRNVPRLRRLLLSASFVLFVLGSAFVSYLLLRRAPLGIKAGALAFVAGLLTVAAVEDMLEEAHAANEDSHRSVLAFVAGFALFTLVSAGLASALATSTPK